MENKYITVAYKLYAITEGKKELLEEAPAEHPFQFISGIGYTLEKFEKEILALNKGDQFNFTIPCAEAYGERDEEITEDKVVLDLNHPHAGKDLIFEGTITEMREATNKEIEGMVNLMSGEGCGCSCDSCGGGCGDHQPEEEAGCGCGCGHCH